MLVICRSNFGCELGRVLCECFTVLVMLCCVSVPLCEPAGALYVAWMLKDVVIHVWQSNTGLYMQSNNGWYPAFCINIATIIKSVGPILPHILQLPEAVQDPPPPPQQTLILRQACLHSASLDFSSHFASPRPCPLAFRPALPLAASCPSLMCVCCPSSADNSAVGRTSW